MSSPPHASGFGTLAISSKNDSSCWGTTELVAPISFSTTHRQPPPSEEGDKDIFRYTRIRNPNRDILQQRLAQLEGGKYCRAFSSGVSCCMCITEYFSSGDHILCSDDVYNGMMDYFSFIAVKRHGLACSYVDMTLPPAEITKALRENTKMVWLETASNPLLKIIDIKAVVDTVKAFNPSILVVVDNTFLTPYLHRPLEFGADAVMHSLTKYLNGHSDVLMGAVITNDPKLDSHLEFMQQVVGAVSSPMDLFLANRGLKTLHVRMQLHSANALRVAQWLETKLGKGVERVHYPSLSSHPQHQVHKRQCPSGKSGGMVSFNIKGTLEEARAFLSHLRVFTVAVSLGGCESLAEIPALMSTKTVHGHDAGQGRSGVARNLIRLSVGLEDVEDLIGDLEQALRKAVGN